MEEGYFLVFRPALVSVVMYVYVCTYVCMQSRIKLSSWAVFNGI